MTLFNSRNRRSIRLKGYDYSKAGAYFVTICVQNRKCLFGKIENKQMKLNDAGQMVNRWYLELANKYPDIECGEYIVMPNHFHCIIINNGNTNVRADPRVCPIINDDSFIIGEPPIINKSTNLPILGEHTGSPILGEHINLPILGEHTGSPLSAVLQWFKTMSTNEYIRGVKNLDWQPFNGKLWQRNYYEHIIRNEQSYQNIANYIINNPVKWNEDKLNTN